MRTPNEEEAAGLLDAYLERARAAAPKESDAPEPDREVEVACTLAER
jgi:hypothetical protein